MSRAIPSRRPRSRVRAAAVLATSGLAFSACGSAALEAGKIEEAVDEQFRRQHIALTDLSCDDGVSAETGTRFRCTAKNPSGTILTIDGKVTGQDGDRALFEAKVVSGVGRGDVLARQVLEQLERKVGRRARGLTCPDEVRMPTREPLRCRLQADRTTAYGVSVTVGATGDLSVEVDRRPLAGGAQP